MKLHNIHPFPARMASEIATEHLRGLSKNALVVDPMCGSGTVLRTCAELGIKSVEFDLDPLAVLMSRVWTHPLTETRVNTFLREILGRADAISAEDIYLPWIDDCSETAAFIDLWFEPKQRLELRYLAWALAPAIGPTADLLRIALSATIITKERGASIARDTSHSRPHRWFRENTFDVRAGFLAQVKKVLSRLRSEKLLEGTIVKRADARRLTHLDDGQVDLILTSPPYLNMIDYMRGHRLALVWLGYSVKTLKEVRARGIGSEVGGSAQDELMERWIGDAAQGAEDLPSREYGMLRRYASDLSLAVTEQARTLKKEGRLVTVVGNSRLRGVYIENSTLNRFAAEKAGLRLESTVTRALPDSSRYLPISSSMRQSALSARMREEVVMTFIKAS